LLGKSVFDLIEKMRTFFTALLALVFVPIFIISILVFNFQAVLLNKDSLKNSLEKTGFYQKIVPAVVRDVDIKSLSASYLTKADILEPANKVLPPDSIKSEMEKTIVGVYPYLLSKTDRLDLEYDLTPYKKALSAQAQKIIKNKIKSLPVCRNSNSASQSSEALPSCRSQDISIDELTNQTINNFNDSLDSLPNQIIVTQSKLKTIPPNSNIKLNKTPEELLKPLRSYLAKLPTVIGATLLILLALMILIVLLKWGSSKVIAKWVGWTLLVSSVLAMLLSLGIYSAAGDLAAASGNIGQSALLGARVLTELIRLAIFIKILPQTIVILIISLALIIISSFIKTKEKTEVTS